MIEAENNKAENRAENNRLERIFALCAALTRPVSVVLCVLLMFSGVYKVESDEVAVILRFGRLAGANPAERIKRPGLHFAFPHVIDEVVKVQAGKIRQSTVTAHYSRGSYIDGDLNRNGYLITGDSNIILLEAAVKYRIDDPIAYALYNSDVTQTVNGAVSSVLQKHASPIDVDSLLTVGKVKLAEETRRDSQEILDRVKCGVTLMNI
jgi:membrane protease subunit HflK